MQTVSYMHSPDLLADEEYLRTWLAITIPTSVRAVNEHEELVGQPDKDNIQKTTAQKKGVKWTFNSPGAPHLSGAHEEIVKAWRLTTVVTGAESLLNSRPLTDRSTNIKDDVPLTPNNCTRERRDYEVQPTGEVAQGLRTDLSSVVQVVEGAINHAEYSSKVDRRRQGP